MPRRKIELGLIREAASRAKSFKQRKKGLKKKAYELAVLTGVDIAVVCSNPGGGEPKKWEFGSAGPGVIDRYRRLPADKRAQHTHLNYLNVQLGNVRKEKARLAKEGPKALASPGKQELNGVDLEELLASIDAALLATAERRKALAMSNPDDGGQLLQPAAAPDALVPLGQEVPLIGDVDDLEAWVDELTWHAVEPHPPLNASTMQPAPADAVQYYINGVEPRQFNSSMTQPTSGIQYFSGSRLGMGGNDQTPLQQMGGNGENDHGQLAWGGYQLHNTVSFPDHSFQYTGSNYSYSDMDACPQMSMPSNATGSNYLYTDMNGCPQMPMPSNGNAYDGFWLNRDAFLDITCNPVYMPPEHSSMGSTGGCFSGVSAIGMDGSSFMDATGHEYETQCLADFFQCPDASQHLGVEPLHYLSDVAEGICYYDLEEGSCSSGRSQPFAQRQSHSSSGTQFCSEQSQSDARNQASGVQNFWVMEEAARFNHSSSGTQFCSEQSQSDARNQASGVQNFWVMEEAARFNQAFPIRCATS